jgi:hypothetical protein
VLKQGPRAPRAVRRASCEANEAVSSACLQECVIQRPSMVVPSFLAGPSLLLQSDDIALIPDRLARLASDAAAGARGRALWGARASRRTRAVLPLRAATRGSSSRHGRRA